MTKEQADAVCVLFGGRTESLPVIATTEFCVVDYYRKCYYFKVRNALVQLADEYTEPEDG